MAIKHPPTALRAALYLRMSLDRTGEGAGVDRQGAACQSLAEARGWTVVRTYVDNGVSATKGERPQWQALLAGAKAGEFDVVLSWALDRLVRRASDLERLIETGVRAATVQGDLDLTTVQGELIAGILANVARAEVRQKGERQRSANLQRAQAGSMSWTRRPFGYDRDDSGIAVVPLEGELLVMACDRLLQGASLARLVREWNSAGHVTSTGGPWTVKSLRHCLLNPRLSGRVTYRGEDVRAGLWQPILTMEKQERLASLLRSPSRRQQVTTSRKYLLSGAVVCGKCGDRMFASPAGSGGARYMAYRCRKQHLMRRLEDVDAVVVGTVLARLALPDAADLLIPDVDLDGLRKEAAALRERRDELAQLLGEGLLSASAVREQAEGLRTRLLRVEAEMETALGVSPALALASAEDVAATWEQLALNDKRRVVDELMTVCLLPAGKGVRFDPQHVAIEWKG